MKLLRNLELQNLSIISNFRLKDWVMSVIIMEKKEGKHKYIIQLMTGIGYFFFYIILRKSKNPNIGQFCHINFQHIEPSSLLTN